jgi:hypothetical protein
VTVPSYCISIAPRAFCLPTCRDLPYAEIQSGRYALAEAPTDPDPTETESLPAPKHPAAAMTFGRAERASHPPTLETPSPNSSSRRSKIPPRTYTCCSSELFIGRRRRCVVGAVERCAIGNGMQISGVEKLR